MGPIHLSADAFWWAQFVVHLRFLSVAIKVVLFAWVITRMEPSKTRATLMGFLLFLILLNIASLMISVMVFGIPPV